MEKLVVGMAARSIIDLAASFENNLRAGARRLGKTLSELTVSLLAIPVMMRASNLCSDLECAFSPSLISEVNAIYGIVSVPEGGFPPR